MLTLPVTMYMYFPDSCPNEKTFCVEIPICNINYKKKSISATLTPVSSPAVHYEKKQQQQNKKQNKKNTIS